MKNQLKWKRNETIKVKVVNWQWHENQLIIFLILTSQTHAVHGSESR